MTTSLIVSHIWVPTLTFVGLPPFWITQSRMSEQTLSFSSGVYMPGTSPLFSMLLVSSRKDSFTIYAGANMSAPGGV